MEFIKIRGARTHNLKNINLDLPRNKLVVITGLSGSGKSSLAFDTLYAEGQRRYVESLSTYARQFLQLMEKPDVDLIEGLSPAIAIEQRATSHNPRSTVGTVTEIHDYMRLLFARAGDPQCPDHGTTLTAQSVSQMVDYVLQLPVDTRLMILSPLIIDRKGEQADLFDELRAQGFMRLRIDGKVYAIDALPKLQKNKKHIVEVVIDRLKVSSDLKQRLAESFETALRHADGRALVMEVDSGHMHLFSAKFSCPICSYSLPELEPRLFSFNSPMGACPKCDGLGQVTFFDSKRIVAFPHLSLASGAIKGWDQRNQFYFHMLVSLSRHYNFDLEIPFEELSTDIQQIILRGSEKEKILFLYLNESGSKNHREHIFEGIIPNLERRYKETDSLAVREELGKYLNSQSCSACSGTRLCREARHVQVGGRAIYEINALSLKEAKTFFDQMRLIGNKHVIAERIVKEISGRLLFLNNVGLDYLSLDRSADTLSGGESQRIRLASQIGSGLTGVMYVLDEPSIGLHQRDNGRLLETLKNLRDLGNSVIVVEHDQDAILAADYGSGKSTLINNTLYNAMARHLYGSNAEPSPYRNLDGLAFFDKVINMDQSPIGRTPRSNPATYTGLFTPIRELFSDTPQARERGYGPGRFSFNVKGGRCEVCQGDGAIKVEMHFLPDIYVSCDVCHGKRYNRETLEILYKDKNINEILHMTVEQAYKFFNSIPVVARKLKTLLEVGLGYIKIGQSATTLSGGEAQRVKLSLELSKRDTGRTLYVLDEPTTGLHFQDIDLLLKVLHRLRDNGNTVVVIEHNLDVIKTADWVIDLGPEGGEYGGHIIAEGTPEEVAENKMSFTGFYLRTALNL